jgi:hypothetical protein
VKALKEDRMTHVTPSRSRDSARNTTHGAARVAATATLLLLASAAIAAGQSRCDAAKLQQFGRRALCLAKVDSKAAQRGDGLDAEKAQRCHERFAERCAKAEGLGDCSAAAKSCAELTADVGGCPGQRTFLINAATVSPIVEVVSPKSGAACASRELEFLVGRNNDLHVETCDRSPSGRVCTAIDAGTLRFRDRSALVGADAIVLGTGDPVAGPIEPVEGPDDLLWLCREDEEGMQCICIPWAQD